ncbi:hypothetical protein BDV19DRAFT_392702 [Aspergillus venezuelensis]
MPRFSNVLYRIVYLFTWPYYATLRRFTIDPLEQIAAPQKDLIELTEHVQDFASGKGTELKYVTLAATINAALTVATFSWPGLAGAPWAVPALLYTSLFFIIGALVTASQHIMFFYKMCPSLTQDHPAGPCVATMHNLQQFARAQFFDKHSHSWAVLFIPEITGDTEEDLLMQRSINPNMILIWQSPIALVAWSWVAYGVAIVVRGPEWTSS